MLTIGLITNANAQGITNTLGGNTANDKFIVENNGGTDLFTVTGDSKVGIGTNTPGFKLDVVGTIQMSGFKLPSSPTSGFVLTSDANGVGTWQAIPSSSADNDWTISGNDIYSAVSGNVGVGIANPSQKLTVYDDSQARIALQIGNSGTTASDGLQIIHGQGTNGQSWIINNENHNFHLGTNGSNDITIENGGQVGIQTTAPNANLDVNGDVILGENGTRFMEIVEITGTTSSSSTHYTSYSDKLPEGWIGDKTRLLSLEIQHNSSNNWASMGAATDGSHSISGWLDNDGRTFWVYYPDQTVWKGTAWRAMIMRMP